jgi:AAHS family benzoate transporter-like MFS transporter
LTPVFVLCWLALLADGFDLYVYGATLPSMIGPEPLGITPQLAGTIGSVALIGMLLGSLSVGMLTDRLGRRRIFMVAVTVFSLAMLGCSAAPNWELFVAARFIACFGVGGLLPTAVALTSEFAPKKSRSVVLGMVLTGPALGTLVAAFVAAGLTEAHGFRPVYAIGGVALLLVPAFAKWLPESPSYLQAIGSTDEANRVRETYGMEPEAAQAAGNAAQAAPTTSRFGALFAGGLARRTLLIWAITLLSLLVMFGVSTWLPQIMRTVGFGISSSITFLVAYSVGAVIGTVLAAIISQKVGPRPLIIVGFTAAALALIAMSTHPSGAVMLVLAAVMGFGGLGTQNMLNDYISQLYPPHARATGLGWALGIGRIGAIVGPSYGAFMLSVGGGFTVALLGFAVPALLGGALMFSLRARRPVAAPAATAPQAADAAR